MELYSNAPGASIIMGDDPHLIKKLDELLKKYNVDVVIESGTFVGTGSTKFLAEAFCRNKFPKSFSTIEVNFTNWLHANVNLLPFPFIDCHWGCSVNLAGALEFIKNDEMVVNHEKYQGIYIDDVEDPVGFYTREILGQIEIIKKTMEDESTKMLWEGEDLLGRLLEVHKTHAPLIVLDSSGGMGFLEFQWVVQKMGDFPYLMLLDDTIHIKHFRSLQYIRSSPEFSIFAEGHNWVIAVHPGSNGHALALP